MPLKYSHIMGFIAEFTVALFGVFLGSHPKEAAPYRLLHLNHLLISEQVLSSVICGRMMTDAFAVR